MKRGRAGRVRAGVNRSGRVVAGSKGLNAEGLGRARRVSCVRAGVNLSGRVVAGSKVLNAEVLGRRRDLVVVGG